MTIRGTKEDYKIKIHVAYTKEQPYDDSKGRKENNIITAGNTEDNKMTMAGNKVNKQTT